MNFLDLFPPQHIIDVLKATFSYSGESKISFAVDKYNENFILLNVKSDGVEQNYALAKVPKYLKAKEHPEAKNSKVLYPVFVLENINKECYGGFEYQHGIENFVPPVQNDIESLKIILRTLAEHQSLDLANSTEGNTPSEYNLQHITNAVTSLDFFKDLDTAIIKEAIENLQLVLNKLIEGSNFLVGSIGCPFGKNVFVNQKRDESIFLSAPSTKIVPPVYDALLCIFALSNEKFRQKHFKNLVLYYFESLIKFLQKQQSSVADEVTRSYREQQVQVFLPVVKLKVANSIIATNNTSKHQDLFTNILYFLKYPLINQEDIYEATKNKIGTNHYTLLDYSLTCLSEKNGHLGDYFHLDIKIKTQEKEQELQLFAKILKTSSDYMDAFVRNGPAKKEDYFYNIFLPLCSKHGLDSLLDFAPGCYLSRVNWVLVLDDLSRQGYIGLKPNIILNYEGLKASIKNLAKFHACTIILEEILSEKSGEIVRLDQDYGEFLKETILIYEENHPSKQMHDDNLELFYYIIEKFPEVTKGIDVSSEEFRAQFKKAFLTLFSKVKKSDTIRNVISHGDMYVANMLFQFDEDKIITNGMLIDFQLLRYTSPNYDLLFFIFENSTKETRNKYLKTLIEDYYQLISENIRKFDYDPEIVFPKKVFYENIKFMMSAGIIGALNYAQMMHIDSDFREEIFHDQEKLQYYLGQHKKELVDLSLKGEHYKNILKGLVEDIVEIIKNEFMFLITFVETCVPNY